MKKWDIRGVIALRNFTARTNGNRLIIQSAENANFTILDTLVNEVEIDGVVYDDVTSAQEALQRLVFNPQRPMILTEKERDYLRRFIETADKGFFEGHVYNLGAGKGCAFRFRENEYLFALKVNGSTKVIVGTHDGGDDLGEYEVEGKGVLQMGFYFTTEWVHIDVTNPAKVTPIFYRE